MLQCGKNCTTKGLGTVGPAKLRSRPITSSVSLRPPCTAPLAHKEKATFAHSLSDFNTPLCTLPCFQPLAAHCIGFLVHTHTHTLEFPMALTDPPHVITGILSRLYALTRGGFYAACPGRNEDWLEQTGQKSMLENQLRPGSWFEGLNTS